VRSHKGRMRTSKMVVVAVLASGCGSKEPPPAETPAAVAPQSEPVNDANRRLSKSECESLASTIADACNNRGNDRSSEADGWCSDMLAKNEGNGTWVTSDCVPHFRYMDAFCFQGARNAHGMMDCDRTVDRTH